MTDEELRLECVKIALRDRQSPLPDLVEDARVLADFVLKGAVTRQPSSP